MSNKNNKLKFSRFIIHSNSSEAMNPILTIAVLPDTSGKMGIGAMSHTLTESKD